MDMLEQLAASAAAFGDEPLLALPDGRTIKLSQGYIPLLVNFTFEDKAAKGLRKRKADDKPESPIYFSALEVVRDNQILLLNGLSGSGKSTFAKYLCFRLASAVSISPLPLFRNDEGAVYDENWSIGNTWPCYFQVHSAEHLRVLAENTLPSLVEAFIYQGREIRPNLLIVVDTIGKAKNRGSLLLAKILSLIKGSAHIKLILLGKFSEFDNWNLSSDITRHEVLPLLQNQRREAGSILTGLLASQVKVGIGAAAATPAYFALALQAQHSGGNAEDLLDAWLAHVAPEGSKTLSLKALSSLGLKSVQPQELQHATLSSVGLVGAKSRVIQQALAARYLAGLPSTTAVQVFHSDPLETEPILRSVLARLRRTQNHVHLIQELVHGSETTAQLGALLASDFVAESSELRGVISSNMLRIIDASTLSILQREKAGRVLSRFGDHRDLTALTQIPSGSFILGSESYSNSAPSSNIYLESFRISVYPVVNSDYSVFVRETGRNWQSEDGHIPERQNAPATDLSWYDAMDYCSWLTELWRSSGKITLNEQVRLPTEPEWERAARGDQIGNYIYPWGDEWVDDTGNYEETGLNRRCSVGLFPKGRSPYGCHDMAGQIWEWCSTLWGEDMTTPSFKYPWCDDGREDLTAPGSIRRVLRGGCFSSGRQKITCTYRGSLEPGGRWRGNGFRIVVASLGSPIQA